MSVTLVEVMSAARCRAASLVAEVAGYLILGAADQVAGAPRAVGAGEVALAEDGSLRLLGGGAAQDEEAEASLRLLLARLLGVSACVTPPLLRTSQRPAGAGVAALVRELEAALIPVNRAAARRALSRLCRDVLRAKQAGKLEPISEPPPTTIERSAAPPPPVQAQDSEPVVAPIADPVDADESAPALRVELDELVDEQPDTPLEPIFSRRHPPPLPRRTEAPQVPDLVLPPSPAATATSARSELEPELEPEPTPTLELEPMLEAEATSEPEPAAEPEPILEPEPEPTVELVGIDATDRMPELAEEPAPPLPARPPPRPEPASVLDLMLVELPVLEQTPTLGALVSASRGSAPSQAGRAQSDPDELVVLGALEQTVRLPAVATPAPRAVVLEQTVPLPPVATPAPPTAEAAPEPIPAPERELVQSSPIAPMPVIALSGLRAAPQRSAAMIPAPPRYAPRRSDVEALVASFEVSPAAEPRALCADLKQLAGVDRTQAPPGVTSRTPPPVVVDDEPSAAAEAPAGRTRIGLGALALMLAIGTGGAIATAVERAPDVVASAPLPGLVELSECAATVAVSGIPAGARASVREGEQRTGRIPSRVRGDEALFTGLRCREPVEVTVASSGARGQSWIRIPVSAEAMTPTPELPSEVRVALSIR
jgi:hypothetical protein